MKQKRGLNDPKSGTFSDMTYVTWFQFTMNQAPVEAQVPSGAMENPPFVDDCSIKISILGDDQSHQRVYIFFLSRIKCELAWKMVCHPIFPKKIKHRKTYTNIGGFNQHRIRTCTNQTLDKQ